MNSQAFTTTARFLLRYRLISLFIIASIGFLFWRWADFTYAQTPCPTGVARDAPHEVTHETCPSLGRMNGVKLAVPQHYLLGPKGYKGIDIWNAESYKKRPQTNSFDNELDNFAIRIRLTNFKPIETFRDRDDYSKLGSLIGVPPPENRWIHVGVKALEKHGTFQDTVSRWRKDEKGWGPFALQPDVWGLKRYVFMQSLTPTNDRWEFLYDSGFGTFATCKHLLQLHPPHAPRESCRLEFSMLELKALIDIDNFGERSDLARWPEIEREVRKVIQSFIVP